MQKKNIHVILPLGKNDVRIQMIRENPGVATSGAFLFRYYGMD